MSLLVANVSTNDSSDGHNLQELPSEITEDKKSQTNIN